MDESTRGGAIEPLDLPAEKDVHCLYMAFEQITDGRKKRGVCSPLAVLLTLIVLRNWLDMRNVAARMRR